MQHRNNRICGYCSRCGEPFGSSARLCSKCGANLASNIKFKQGKQPLSYEEKIDTMYNDAQFCLSTISKRDKISGRIWIVTAVIQIILSIIAFPFPFWIAAILNTICAIQRFKYSKMILVPNKLLLSKYGQHEWAALHNILVGGVVIGLVGWFYDANTKNYVEANFGLLEWYCNVR